MERVTGIGGVFFAAQDPDRLTAWYRDYADLHDPEGNPIQLWQPSGVDL